MQVVVIGEYVSFCVCQFTVSTAPNIHSASACQLSTHYILITE